MHLKYFLFLLFLIYRKPIENKTISQGNKDVENIHSYSIITSTFDPWMGCLKYLQTWVGVDYTENHLLYSVSDLDIEFI